HGRRRASHAFFCVTQRGGPQGRRRGRKPLCRPCPPPQAEIVVLRDHLAAAADFRYLGGLPAKFWSLSRVMRHGCSEEKDIQVAPRYASRAPRLGQGRLRRVRELRRAYAPTPCLPGVRSISRSRGGRSKDGVSEAPEGSGGR